MLKIGDFSKLSRISIRMLRHYDELGLLVPKATDNFTSYRYYAEDQLPVAGRIVAMRDMDFGLAAIGEILKNYDNPQALAEFLAVKQAEVNDAMQKLFEKHVPQATREYIENRLKRDALVKEKPKRPVRPAPHRVDESQV